MKKIIVFIMVLSLFAFAEETKQSCKQKGFKYNRRAKACKSTKIRKRRKCEEFLGDDGWDKKVGSCKVSRKELKLLKEKIQVKSLQCKRKIKIGTKAAAAVKSLTKKWNEITSQESIVLKNKHKNIIQFEFSADGKDKVFYIKAGKQFVKAEIMPTPDGVADTSENKIVKMGSKVIRFNAKEGSLDSRALDNVIFKTEFKQSQKEKKLKVEELRIQKAKKAYENFNSAASSSCKYYFDGKQFKKVND